MITIDQKTELDEAVKGIESLPNLMLFAVEKFMMLLLIFFWIFRHNEPEPELLEKIIELKQIRLKKKTERLQRIFKA